MRTILGLGIVGVSIALFGWWGALSLLIALPFIGWQDRHKGPFPTNQPQTQTSSYIVGMNLGNEAPKSFKLMQNILMKASKKSTSKDDLLPALSQLRDSLRMEKPFIEDTDDRKLLHDFLIQFSSAFPNWKSEYSILSDLIDSNFD